MKGLVVVVEVLEGDLEVLIRFESFKQFCGCMRLKVRSPDCRKNLNRDGFKCVVDVVEGSKSNPRLLI
jgi:hypothetical protein